jgi:hypothetical protein
MAARGGAGTWTVAAENLYGAEIRKTGLLNIHGKQGPFKGGLASMGAVRQLHRIKQT